MNKFILVFLFFLIPSFSFAETISGNVREDNFLNKKSVIIDSETEKAIEGAKVYLPNYGFSTSTDSKGRFELNANIQDKAILQVEKDGYRPFSITVDKSITERPLKLGIEKLNASDIFVDSGVFHLGDDVNIVSTSGCIV